MTNQMNSQRANRRKEEPQGRKNDATANMTCGMLLDRESAPAFSARMQGILLPPHTPKRGQRCPSIEICFWDKSGLLAVGLRQSLVPVSARSQTTDTLARTR